MPKTLKETSLGLPPLAQATGIDRGMYMHRLGILMVSLLLGAELLGVILACLLRPWLIAPAALVLSCTASLVYRRTHRKSSDRAPILGAIRVRTDGASPDAPQVTGNSDHQDEPPSVETRVWSQAFQPIVHLVRPVMHHMIAGVVLLTATYALFGMIALFIPNAGLRGSLLTEAALYAMVALCILGFYSIASLVLELGGSLVGKALDNLDELKKRKAGYRGERSTPLSRRTQTPLHESPQVTTNSRYQHQLAGVSRLGLNHALVSSMAAVKPVTYHLIAGLVLISATYALFGMIGLFAPDPELKSSLLTQAAVYAKVAYCILGFYSVCWLLLELGASLVGALLDRVGEVKINGERTRGEHRTLLSRRMETRLGFLYRGMTGRDPASTIKLYLITYSPVVAALSLYIWFKGF